MWLPRADIRRRQETLPSIRHPAAFEPLMLHSAGDEKGKAHESIGSWAFPAFIRGLPLFDGITISQVVIWYYGNCHQWWGGNAQPLSCSTSGYIVLSSYPARPGISPRSKSKMCVRQTKPSETDTFILGTRRKCVTSDIH